LSPDLSKNIEIERGAREAGLELGLANFLII
jgi:hypothetical protein